MPLTREVHRAKEPVSRCLIRQLTVPYIYWEAPWPGPDSARVDLVAIDRAGTGDVHVVEIATPGADIHRTLQSIARVPAHYRWIATLPGSAAAAYGEELFPIDGPGRVGVIEVVRMSGDDWGANVRVRAERFQQNLSEKADRFVATQTPDIRFD